MSKRLVFTLLPFIVWILLLPNDGMSTDLSNVEIMEELRELKRRINELEEELKTRDQEMEKLKVESVRREDMAGVMEEMQSEGGLLDTVQDRLSVSGLIELGAAYESVDNRDGGDDDQSDVNLTTVELTVGAEVNEWVNVETVFLYEDATFGDDTSVDLDVGTVTIGNTEKYPCYFTGGKMYLPFGALLTHFPDDPLVDQPMTLGLGEINEKAALVGFEYLGLAISGYVFNGDVDDSPEDNVVESFGFDVNYTLPEDRPFELFVGASYISNIADTDGLTDGLNLDEIEDYVGGADLYLHLGCNDFFFDAEYMTALEEFDPGELANGGGDGAEPSVWNIEVGYEWNWGRSLEIVLKYAGSDETEGLGYPEDRYGFGLNQEIFEGITGSVAFFHDEFHGDDVDARNDRDVIFGQIALEF
ncbi:MAG: LbtU family siderophore porin [Thermodesulfobacteriota bacterium]|nr:LbtU family siderophore porin [Thermodesulfobacteriota bacterium]